MLIRCFQYVSLIVLTIPVFLVMRKFSEISTIELFAIILVSLVLLILSLGIRLKIYGAQRISAMPHIASAALFIYLLWRFSAEASHFLLAVYLAALHAFAAHWLLTTRHPLSPKHWIEMDRNEKILLGFFTLMQALAIPLFIIWLYYIVLFPSLSDKQTFGDLGFYIGIPMTLFGVCFAVIFLGVQIFLLRKPKA